MRNSVRNQPRQRLDNAPGFARTLATAGGQLALEAGDRRPDLVAVRNLRVAPPVRLYRDPQLRAVIDDHRTRQADARTLTGLAHEIAHLRTALEAVADNVRRHEEQLRRLERRAGRKTG